MTAFRVPASVTKWLCDSAMSGGGQVKGSAVAADTSPASCLALGRTLTGKLEEINFQPGHEILPIVRAGTRCRPAPMATGWPATASLANTANRMASLASGATPSASVVAKQAPGRWRRSAASSVGLWAPPPLAYTGGQAREPNACCTARATPVALSSTSVASVSSRPRASVPLRCWAAAR
jgi:hypothetical protein